MKTYSSLGKPNYFLNVVILLFITFVFINFIHNTFDNYQGDNIKIEVSEKLSSDKTYAYILK